MLGLEFLKRKLNTFQPGVTLRYAKYDARNTDSEPGFTIPSKYRNAYRATLGWCAKAVDALADRLVFRTFVDDNFELDEIFKLNNPDVFFDSAILSALISSCCFVYISKGDDGFPRLQIIEGSLATGAIDPITGLLAEGYAVLKTSDNGEIELEAHFLPDRTDYYSSGNLVNSIANPSGVPLLVPIIHRPDAVRPFGRSRITKAAMYYQHLASRTMMRSDVTAEFYSFPQKYAVGLSDDAEVMDTWKATVSSFLTFTKDSEGDSPKLGQFQTPSMSPFTEQIRTAASLFAGETGLTLDDLGFVSDNPSSAESIKASHETLRAMARKAQRCFGSGFLNVGYVAACLRDDYAYRRNQFYLTTPKWQPIFEPDASTMGLVGDAVIKINQAIPGYFDKDNVQELTGIQGSNATVNMDAGVAGDA